MKIVIISYSVYPINAPRAHRATELAKEFGRQGYDVYLYALLGKYDYSSIEKEYNIKVKNIGKHLFSRFTSDNTSSKPDYLLTRAIKKIIGKWIEFPNIDLVRLTFNVLKKERDIDLLITIATPFTIHWGAALWRSLHKNKLRKTIWIADCGDPFMGNPFHTHPFYFKYVEKWFCRKADYLSIPIEGAKEAYYPECHEKIKVIPQGFSFGDINFEGNYRTNPVPTFIYAGVFYAGIRDPRPLLDYLVKLNVEFRFIVYTKSKNLLEDYKDILKEKMIINDYIPREELLVEMSKADFLLNIENDTTMQLPSKLIDYALTKRPILSINSNKPLNEALINQFLRRDYSQSMKIENVDQYNIKNIANNFLSLANQD